MFYVPAREGTWQTSVSLLSHQLMQAPVGTVQRQQQQQQQQQASAAEVPQEPGLREAYPLQVPDAISCCKLQAPLQVLALHADVLLVQQPGYSFLLSGPRSQPKASISDRQSSSVPTGQDELPMAASQAAHDEGECPMPALAAA